MSHGFDSLAFGLTSLSFNFSLQKLFNAHWNLVRYNLEAHSLCFN